MRFGKHYHSVLSLIPMIDPGPRWAAGSSSWFKTNYVMMILRRRLWVWCVWLGAQWKENKSPNSVKEHTLESMLSVCVFLFFHIISSSFLCWNKKKIEFLINVFDHHNQPRSILCFCLPSRILKSHLICKTKQCNNNHTHATPTLKQSHWGSSHEFLYIVEMNFERALYYFISPEWNPPPWSNIHEN